MFGFLKRLLRSLFGGRELPAPPRGAPVAADARKRPAGRRGGADEEDGVHLAPNDVTNPDILHVPRERAEDVLDVADQLIEYLESSDAAPPLFPDAGREAYQASLNPHASYAKIARILEKDPALSMRLLQLANSAMFSRGMPVEGIQQAMNRVGLNGLRDLLVMAAGHRILVIRGNQGLTRRLQSRAPAVALASRCVADLIGEDRDAAFTAGLLHDVGWPAAFDLLRNRAPELPVWVREKPQRWVEIAEVVHERLGEVLATKWELAPGTIAAIGYHHDPEMAGEGRTAALVVSSALALVDYLNYYPEMQVRLPSDRPAVKLLGLGSRNVAWVTEELRKLLAEELGHRGPAA
jgi:HD-like signal output (HDOD) protein